MQLGAELLRLTEYKALKTDSRIVFVPAAYSTQECFHCGTLNKIDLSVESSSASAAAVLSKEIPMPHASC